MPICIRKHVSRPGCNPRKARMVRVLRNLTLCSCVVSIGVLFIYSSTTTRTSIDISQSGNKTTRVIGDSKLQGILTTQATISTSQQVQTSSKKPEIVLKFNHPRFKSFIKWIDNASQITWINSSFDNILKKNSTPESSQNKSRILCLVTSTPKNEFTRALAVNKTWGSRCTRLMFVFTRHRSVFDHISLNVTDGRSHLTAKTMTAFKYVYEHYKDDFDWIVKADDDTYLIVENLRFLLSKFDPNEPAYLGYHFKVHVHNGYMSGGGSYVLSQKALELLVEKGFTKEVGCATDSADEDVEVGRCMEKLGVKPYITRDKFGRDSFHPQSLEHHIVGPMPYYISYYPAHPIKIGPDCCSQFSISFHYVTHNMMYIIDLLLYRISIHGNDDIPEHHIEDFFVKKESQIKHESKDEIFKIKHRHKYSYFIPLSDTTDKV